MRSKSEWIQRSRKSQTPRLVGMEEPAIHSLWGSTGMVQKERVFLSLKPPVAVIKHLLLIKMSPAVQGSMFLNHKPKKASLMTFVAPFRLFFYTQYINYIFLHFNTSDVAFSPLLWDFFPPSFHCFLTSAYAPGHGHVIAIITLQPFVVVARPRRAAILVKLCSTHLAASTPVWDGAHAWRADRRLCRALTHRWAASSHLKDSHIQTKLRTRLVYMRVCVCVAFSIITVIIIIKIKQSKIKTINPTGLHL